MLVCIILSGGRSSRMGVLKQNLDFLGQSLANFQAKNFYQIFKNIYFLVKPLLPMITISRQFLQKNSLLKIMEIFKQYQKATFAKINRIHPLIGIYPKDSLPLINKQIQKGNYRLMDLLKNIKSLKFVKISDQESSNLNYPKDYQEAIKRIIDGG